MTRSVRFGTALAVAAPLLFSSVSSRAAGAVLHPATESDPTTLDAEIAVASTPYATTRWMRVHVAGPTHVLWLVPVRPGAAVDWTDDSWLDSLDDATAPRVLPPDTYPPCGFGHGTERVPSWVPKSTTEPAGPVGVNLTLDDLHAAAKGFVLPAATDAALGEIFASGDAVLSIPITIPSFTNAASATLRVSDDAPNDVPLALFGSSATAARVDAIAIAPVPVAVAGARDVDPSLLTWGQNGSSYASARSSTLLAGAGATWIRESSMREPLFDGVPSVSAPALVDRFAPTCAGAMRDAASASGAVGRACPAGAAARVPGGPGCAPSSGAIDPSFFACAGSDDLALALSGSTPRSVIVSRLSGIVSSGTLGADDALATSSTRNLLLQAGSYGSCAPPPGPGTTSSSSSSSSSSGGYSGSSSSGSGTAVVVAPVAEGSDEGCGSSDTSYSDDGDDSSSDGCGSSSTESSDDSSSGSSDGCSSSSSSDGDDGGDDSSSDKKSDDSCGGSSSLAPKKTSMRHKRSPVSRAALLAIALILPFRRRLRRAG